MHISHDSYEKISIITKLILNSYSVFIGSFYSIFVPQLCPGTIIVGNSTFPSSHSCTLTENVTDLIPFNWGVLIFNAITAFVLFVAFGYELYRENWMVDNFDITPDKPENNLEKQIEEHIDIKERFLEISYNYYVLFLLTAAFNVVNMIISAILIFYYYYDTNQSVSTFITNTVIIISRLIKSINISRINKNDIKAESVFLTQQIKFNVVGNILTPISSPASTVHVDSPVHLNVPPSSPVSAIKEKSIELTVV